MKTGQIGIFKAVNHDEVTIKILIDDTQEIEIRLTSTEFTNALFGKLTKCKVDRLNN